MTHTAPRRRNGPSHDRPAAVLWDMDGTIIDTEPYWIEAEITLAKRDGGHWTHEDGLSLIGQAIPKSAGILRERAGVTGSIEEITDDLIRLVGEQLRAHGAPWQPGAKEDRKSTRLNSSH